MTVEPAKHGIPLSILRADTPVDDLRLRLEAAQQGDALAVSLLMWGAHDGLAVRLQAGCPPRQALAEWSRQTGWDIVALDAQGRAGGTVTRAPLPEAKGLAALSHLFAGALLNSDPKWQAQAEAWDRWFETASERAGPSPASSTNLDMELIEQAHAELSGVAETAAQAQLEAVLARAAKQAQGRAERQTAHLAQDREAVLAAALLDMARAGEADVSETGA